jgi:hypothetical protein
VPRHDAVDPDAGKRKMSAAIKAKMAAAQKARWGEDEGGEMMDD